MADRGLYTMEPELHITQGNKPAGSQQKGVQRPRRGRCNSPHELKNICARTLESEPTMIARSFGKAPSKST